MLNSHELMPLQVCVLASPDVISQSLNVNSNNVIPQRVVLKVNMFMTESDWCQMLELYEQTGLDGVVP